jgi:hypothetical protein
MIYALATVPKIFDGQEISAQDLNNLSQNAELLEEIVHSPDRLFLSNWRLAPPVFTLINQKAEQGNLDTFAGYQQAIQINSCDVWEGSFIYREGMHTLRLAFNTYPISERGPTTYYYGVDLSDIRTSYFPRDVTKVNADYINESTSLFLSIKYTDVPLRTQLAKNKKTVRSWVYAGGKKATYKQPYDETKNSYTFTEDATTPDETWNANGATLSPLGYHTYTLDITKFDFVPGEIVNLKFTIATRDGNPVKNWGRHFYFSMVYANIDHGFIENTWVDLDDADITSLSKIDEIANNQKIIVDYFRKYDNPLRAALWDQVMAGGSILPFYARFDTIALQGLAQWGFNNAEEYRYRNTHVAQAKYYLPKRFDLKNTVSMSYNVQVNSKSAFSIQAQLSKSPITAGLIYKPRDTDDSYNNPSFIYSKSHMTADNIYRFPQEIPLGRMNYKDQHFNAEQQAIDSVFARLGKVNFMGTYTNVQNGVSKTYETNLMPAGITSIPAGYPGTREFLYYRGDDPGTQDAWHGFYFIRPGRLGDGGVPYYSAFGTRILGLEQSMFLGPTAAVGEFRDAAYYVDDFNFVLDSQAARAGVLANTRFYPAMYREYGGLPTHADYFIEKSDAYTDFTINVKESSNSWSSNVGMFATPAGTQKENFSVQAFNKASYISTLRLAEVARKESSYTRTVLGRFESFQEATIEELLLFLKEVNQSLKDTYALITQDPVYRYIPVFWNKPKSSLQHFEQTTIGKDQEKSYYQAMEKNTVYFSSTRQADYLVVRGRDISIGWNGFTKIYRDNPKNVLFPAPLEFTFAQSQSLTGADIETTVIGFDTLEGLNYGQRYYIQGEVYFAAETMGVP